MCYKVAPGRAFQLTPSDCNQIISFSCLGVYHKSPNSGERQYKSRTCTRRFDPTPWQGPTLFLRFKYHLFAATTGSLITL